MYWNYLKDHTLEVAIIILVIVIAVMIYKKKKEGFIDSELWLRRRPDRYWEDSTYGSIYDSDNLFTGYPFYDKAY